MTVVAQDLINLDEIYLRPINHSDSAFLKRLFSDAEMRKYYVLPKSLSVDLNKLLEHFISQSHNGKEITMVIEKRKTGFFSSNKTTGIISFRFSNILKTVIVSYGLLSEYRNCGYVKKTLKYFIEKFRENGFECMAADVNEKNVKSERLLKGFLFSKKTMLIDPVTYYTVESATRFLWELDLIKKPLLEHTSELYVKVKMEVEKFVNLSGKDQGLNRALLNFISDLSYLVSTNLDNSNVSMFEEKCIIMMAEIYFHDIQKSNPTKKFDSSVYALISIASGLAIDNFKVENKFAPTILLPTASPISGEILAFVNLVNVFGPPSNF